MSLALPPKTFVTTDGIALAKESDQKAPTRYSLFDAKKNTVTVMSSSADTNAPDAFVMLAIKDLTEQAIKDHPMIVLDNNVLGEPRIAGTRMAVSIVLTALVEYGSFEAVKSEYESTYSEEELKAAVKFARDFLEMCYDKSRRITSTTR